MTTKVLYSLIILTSALLAVLNIASQEYLLAGIAILVGMAWLFLLVRKQEPPHSLFFVVFLGLTVLGNLRNVSAPLMVLTLSTNLAAWDLSRFLARISHEDESAAKTSLESNHLQKLAIPLVIGFFVALIPTFIHFSLNFVVFLTVLLLLMLILRRSILSLRKEI